MFIALAPTHAASGSLQQALRCINNGMRVHLLPGHLISNLDHGRVDTRNVAVNVDALPVSLRYMIRLMVDREMRVFLESRLVPPIPSVTMIRRVCKLLQSFVCLEVANLHDLIVGSAVAAVDPARHAQEIELVGMSLKVLGHLYEVVVDLFDSRRKEAHRVVEACPDEEYNNVLVRGFFAEIAFFIWEHDAEFLVDHSVHHSVALPTHGLRVGV